MQRRHLATLGHQGNEEKGSVVIVQFEDRTVKEVLTGEEFSDEDLDSHARQALKYARNLQDASGCFDDMHEKVTAALRHLNDVVDVVYNPYEHDHPETIVCRKEQTVDQNVEVIYCDDVVLLQENGNDGKDRTAFVWLKHNQNWTIEVGSLVSEWLDDENDEDEDDEDEDDE